MPLHRTVHLAQHPVGMPAPTDFSIEEFAAAERGMAYSSCGTSTSASSRPYVPDCRRPIRYTCVRDVGHALHRAYVEGQMQGGAVQGIGMALTEEYSYDGSGVLRNASFLDYRTPTAFDAQMVETVIAEVPHPGHPPGVRGVGECSILPPIGAIANAIHDAEGIRVHSLPATPRVLLEQILDCDGERGAAS